MDQDRISNRGHFLWENAGKFDAAQNDNWQRAYCGTEAKSGAALPDQQSATDVPAAEDS